MTIRRINFAEEPEHPQPKNFWVTRMLVTGIVVGCAAAAHILLGYKLF